MKLTIKIKLLPDKEQTELLLLTMKDSNSACNNISEIAFKKRLFNQFKIHKESYYLIKNSFNLSAQMCVRCISKVTDSYKHNKKSKHIFKKYGSIAYDSRIMTYKPNNIVSLWCFGGRQNIKFIFHNEKYLSYIRGEADLVYKNKKFYLFQTIELPEDDIKDSNEFIGCDFGQRDIVTLSDGTNFNSEKLKEVRKKYTKLRASIQRKGTKSSKKLLKRLSGKESRFVSISNHSISKTIVKMAKNQNKGIAIEDLGNITKNIKSKSKVHKMELNRWSFKQLRQFLTYKSKLEGIKLFAIPPQYTSQTCNKCKHIGDRNGKIFKCKNCKNITDADFNAAKNISTWGQIVNFPEKSSLFCDL